MMNTPVNPSCQPRLIETDVKPTRNLSNNILKFVEEYRTELERIQGEYRTKFLLDQHLIEEQINQLINNERMSLGRLKRKHCSRFSR